MANVLLVHPPLLPSGEVAPPVGLCTLASWLLHQGHQVRILDLDLETAGAVSASRFPEIFDRVLRGSRPDVVAVTSMYSNSLQAEHLIRRAKERDPSVLTIAGGSHFGALGPQSLSRIAELDYVVEGEGELAFAELLDAIDDGRGVEEIPRLCYRAGGEPRRNPGDALISLADLPPMWRTLGSSVDLDRYARTVPADAHRRIVYVEAGRGCPFACTFCATAPFWQRRFRVKPAQRIVDEMRFLHEELGYDSFILVHDLLTVNQRFVAEFCDAMLAARLPVEWMANSRTDMRLHGLLPKMKAAGCWKLFMGVESANQAVQRVIDKNLRPDESTTTVADLRDHGISATCSFIIGFPEESARDLSPTIALGARLKLLGAETVQFHRLRLFPPARLTRTGLVGEFDLDALRIEYPFIDIPAEDIAAIAADPQFFSGYFTPTSDTGSSVQLAQVEMFFHHVVALAPLTVCALSVFRGDELVPSFYAALAAHGGIDRGELDWEGGDLAGNWRVLRPLLSAWIEAQPALTDWQGAMVRGLVGYEAQRLAFVTGGHTPTAEVRVSGLNWAAVIVAVDVAEILGRMQSGGPLEPDLVRDGIIVLARQRSGSFAAYTAEPALLPRLAAREPALVRVLTG